MKGRTFRKLPLKDRWYDHTGVPYSRKQRGVVARNIYSQREAYIRTDEEIEEKPEPVPIFAYLKRTDPDKGPWLSPIRMPDVEYINVDRIEVERRSPSPRPDLPFYLPYSDTSSSFEQPSQSESSISQGVPHNGSPLSKRSKIPAPYQGEGRVPVQRRCRGGRGIFYGPSVSATNKDTDKRQRSGNSQDSQSSESSSSTVRGQHYDQRGGKTRTRGRGAFRGAVGYWRPTPQWQTPAPPPGTSPLLKNQRAAPPQQPAAPTRNVMPAEFAEDVTPEGLMRQARLLLEAAERLKYQRDAQYFGTYEPQPPPQTFFANINLTGGRNLRTGLSGDGRDSPSATCATAATIPRATPREKGQGDVQTSSEVA